MHVQTEDYLDLERLKQKVELQKQLIEEQDLLLQQCLSAESDGDSIQLSDSIRGAFEILESSGDDRIMSVVQVLRNEYQRLKNRNDLAQQLIREYEQLDRNAT